MDRTFRKLCRSEQVGERRRQVEMDARTPGRIGADSIPKTSLRATFPNMVSAKMRYFIISIPTVQESAVWQNCRLERLKRNDGDWASFGDALRVPLVDKAYQELEEKARECLALNQFLSQIDNPHLSFSVKQTRPETVDKAATTIIEMQTDLGHSSSKTIGTCSK
eukprot:Em0001g3267a